MEIDAGDQEAVAVVQRQLDAYNARDLEAFCATYHPAVVVEDGFGQVVLTGMAELRRAYADRFARPELHAELVGRLAVGPWVVDQERVTGLEVEPVHAIATYLVREGVITRVRLIRG
ncbi:hypothetical protein LX15_005153 [Streptoalloteichus tenebrarius]|uniref:SnoaL-like domain-containing protein n=1 Tax=Streptoalloteichus tenebrarius (strain ATCC 17920 / DSM 40477 / JCM 4838 / CBS 697.72 / NBRC 16177 / NCIMB 11028 / NRRL B-12390 / A12253. 1 / ISP 5477) TaxID=1933 RepID=A0ABT1I0W9_STRSD|nr:nuclear transport factor 2 family protein [Streptoalloteichus tenebrarius]MCP2261427.1 hypothetical protein [Streptoalloteichus tenebrarius]